MPYDRGEKGLHFHSIREAVTEARDERSTK
jgi:hypothetical protein